MGAAIQVEGLSKRYRLGVDQTSSLGGVLSGVGRGLRQAAQDLARGRWPSKKTVSVPEIWALRDVSLTIQPGEMVGIVGRNGNGKSTLLKVLSRITMPTSGRIRIQGSVASLLEVGTGFHPELTGRENVFLNGAILGMSRKQIRSKLDAIISFAEVERFMDTPVKRYSSGMYVRLAFAVAAHLEPDILFVDEVLAVGDGAFQKKCLGQLESVGKSNRTVLFVSHSLSAVRSICKRTLLLNEGRIQMDGPTDQVLTEYNRLLQAPRDISQEGYAYRLFYSTGAMRVSSLTAQDGQGRETWNFRQGDDVALVIQYEAVESVPSLGVYVALTSIHSGEVVTTLKAAISSQKIDAGHRGTIQINFPEIPLRAGEYSLTLFLGDEACEKRYDYLNHHQSLPWLCISSDEKDLLQLSGYFSIPASVEQHAL